jgi:hypothetical protein
MIDQTADGRSSLTFNALHELTPDRENHTALPELLNSQGQLRFWLNGAAPRLQRMAMKW